MSDPDLFGVKRDKPARRKAPPAPAGAVQHLIGVYKALYEARFRELPVVLQRDGAVLKSLVVAYGAEKVEARLQAFMAWDDRFVAESGYALTLLQSQWNRLAAMVLQAAEPRGLVPDAEQTRTYLQGLKTGRKC